MKRERKQEERKEKEFPFLPRTECTRGGEKESWRKRKRERRGLFPLAQTEPREREGEKKKE
jgi:hypothetical protein